MTADPPTRAFPLWTLPAAAGAMLLLALLVGGGAPQPAPPGIPDPGAVTGWGLPVLRLGADLAAVVAVGLALAAAFLLPAPSVQLRGERARAADLVVWAAGAEVVLVAVQLPLTLSNVLAIPPSQALNPSLLDQFVTQTDLGRALAAQLVLAAVTAITALPVRPCSPASRWRRPARGPGHG